MRWLLVAGTLDSTRIEGCDSLAVLDRGYRAVRVPRYNGVRDALLAMAEKPALVRAVEISGNQRVAITGTAPESWRPPPGITPILAYKVPIDRKRIRVLLDVPAPELVLLLNAERRSAQGLRVDHVYDY
jgi:hypothetical protein